MRIKVKRDDLVKRVDEKIKVVQREIDARVKKARSEFDANRKKLEAKITAANAQYIEKLQEALREAKGKDGYGPATHWLYHNSAPDKNVDEFNESKVDMYARGQGDLREVLGELQRAKALLEIVTDESIEINDNKATGIAAILNYVL